MNDLQRGRSTQNWGAGNGLAVLVGIIVGAVVGIYVGGVIGPLATIVGGFVVGPAIGAFVAQRAMLELWGQSCR